MPGNYLNAGAEYIFTPKGDDSFMSDPRRACKGEPHARFFPRGAGVNQETRDMCAGCPVREACLQWALDNDEYGFWGGTSTEERAHMLGKQRSKWRR